MKKCTYCGKEFPDDAKACDIDGTPFDAPPPVLDDSSSGRAPPGVIGPLIFVLGLGVLVFVFSSSAAIGLRIGVSWMLGFMLVTVYIAHKKGFNPWCWVFAAGFLGLIVILCLSSASRPELSKPIAEERRRLGNRIGIILIAVGLGLTIATYFL